MTRATVVKEIGAAGGLPYSSLAAWEAGAPAVLATCKQWACGSFSGTFVQGESLTITGSGATGNFLDTDNSTFIVVEVLSGTLAFGDVITGASASCTVTAYFATHTGVIWEGQIEDATDYFDLGTTPLSVGGFTSDGASILHLTTKAGASFRDHASVQTNALRWNASNGAAITCSSIYSNGTIYLLTAGFKLTNLQVQGTTIGLAFVTAGAYSANIDFCILEGNGATQGALYLYGNAQKITNSLIVNRKSGGGAIAQIGNASSAFNCTFVTPNDLTPAGEGFSGIYSGATVSNCVFAGCTATNSSGGAPTISDCYATDASPPSGVTTIAYDTTTGTGFENILDATHDYRIKATSTLVDAAANDASYAVFDIAGTTRPQAGNNDVGAWEYVSASSIKTPLHYFQHVARLGR